MLKIRKYIALVITVVLFLSGINTALALVVKPNLEESDILESYEVPRLMGNSTKIKTFTNATGTYSISPDGQITSASQSELNNYENDPRFTIHEEVEEGPQENDLIMRCNFNEGSGTDVIINNGALAGIINGTTNAGWDSSLNEAFNYSHVFDESNQEHINFTDRDELSFDKSGSAEDMPFTIEFWYSVTWAFPIFKSIFVKGNSTEGYEWEFFLDDEAYLNFGLYDGDGTNAIFETTTFSQYTHDNEWTHVAFSYFGNLKSNSSAGKIYVNGTYQTTSTVSGATQTAWGGLNNTDTLFTLGRHGANYMDGWFDEFRIWNKSLTASEIAYLYSNAPDIGLSETFGLSVEVNNIIDSSDYLHGTTTDLFYNPNRMTDTESLDDLIAYWKMDEGQDSTIYDETTNDHDGNTIGSPAWVSSFNTAANWSLDFEESLTQYAIFGDDDDFSFVGDIPFSVDAWFQLESYDSDGVIISKFQTSGTGNKEWIYQQEDGELTFTLHDQDEAYTNYLRVTHSTTISEGSAWMHVAFTYDGSENPSGMTVYLNGANDTSSRTESGTYPGMTNTAQGVYIGRQQDADMMDGKIDNVRIWNKELSSSEVANLYASAPIGFPQGQDFTVNMTVYFNGTMIDLDFINLTESWFGESPNINITDLTLTPEQYILNPSFEDGTGGSADYWSGTATRGSGTQRTGTYCMSFDSNEYIEQDITPDIASNLVHNFTFWCNAGFEGNITAIVFYTDDTNTTYQWTAPAGAGSYRLYDITGLLELEKIIDKIRFKDTGSTSYYIDDVYLYQLPSGNANFTIDILSSHTQSGTMVISIWTNNPHTTNTSLGVSIDNVGPAISFSTASESSNYLYYNTGQVGYFSDRMGATGTDFVVNGTASDESGVSFVNCSSIFGETAPSNDGTNESWSFAFPIDLDYTTYFWDQKIANPSFESAGSWTEGTGASRTGGPGWDGFSTYHKGYPDSDFYSYILFYADGWIRQNLADIPANDVDYFYIWVRANWVQGLNIRVTVRYNDTTETNHDYFTIGNANWEQYIITGLTAGKFIDRVTVTNMETEHNIYVDDVYMYTAYDWLNDTSYFVAYDNVGNPSNEYPKIDNLTVFLEFNDQSSGQPSTVIDSSPNDWTISPSWTSGSGFNASSYNESALYSVKQIDEGRFRENTYQLNLNDTTTHTIGFWVYIDVTPDSQMDLLYMDGGARIYINTDRTVRYVAEGVSGFNSQTALVEDTWYFVACSYNGSHAIIYINGTEDTAQSGTYTPSWPGSRFTIGGGTADVEWFLDDFFMYNESLSDLDIQILYNRRLSTEVGFTFISDLTAPRLSSSFDPLSEYSETGSIDKVYADLTTDTFYFSNDTTFEANVTFTANVTDAAWGNSGVGMRGVDFSSFGTDDPAEDQTAPYHGNYTINNSDISGTITVNAIDLVGNNAIEKIYCYEDVWLGVLNITDEIETSAYLWAEYGNGTQGYYGDAMPSAQSFIINGTLITNITTLENTDFESALTYWTTNASRSTSARHNGSYGIEFYTGSGSSKNDAYLEQDGLWIPSDLVAIFTFTAVDEPNNVIKLTIFYSDGSNSTEQFAKSPSYSGVYWQQYNVSNIDAGKIITRIRFVSDYTAPDSDYCRLDHIIFTLTESGFNSTIDNTTFGDNPSNSGTTENWSFNYQIDSADSGNITVVYTAYDNVNNSLTRNYLFYDDNYYPQIDWQDSQTNETSDYLYHNGTQGGYYGDEMSGEGDLNPGNESLSLWLLLDEAGSGQPDVYDSSDYNHPVTENWYYTDGMNASSYNNDALYCAQFINDSHFIIPHHASLQQVGDGTYGKYYFTLGFWLYIDSAPQNTFTYLVRKRYAYEVWLRNDSATSYQPKLRFVVSEWGETTNYLYSNGYFNLNQWYFILTFVNTSGYMNIYINGTYDNSLNIGGIAASDSTNDLYLGSYAGDEYTNIYMDSLFFYFNRTFTDAQIWYLYQGSPDLGVTTFPIFNVGGTASDQGTGIASLVDDTSFGLNPSMSGTYALWTFAYNISSTMGGVYDTINVTYTVTDMVGNSNTTWFIFYYDPLGPTGTLNDEADALALVDNYHDDQTVNITVTGVYDQGDGGGSGEQINYIRWKLDSGSWGSWNTTLNINFTLSEGAHTIYIQMRDNVSNIEEYSITVYVDLTDPTLDSFDYENPTYDPNYYRSSAGTGYADYNVTWTEVYPYEVNASLTEFSYTESDGPSPYPSGGNSSFTNLQVAGRNPGIARYYNITIWIYDRSGRSASYTTTGTDTLYIDNYAPTMTFALDQHPDALANNFWKLLLVNATVSGADDNDNSSGIPTLAYAYRVEGSGWGTWTSDTTPQFTGTDQYNVTIYAKIRDNVGNERTYTDWVIVDTLFPDLDWLYLNESWAPNWFDQEQSTAAGVTVYWTEAYPFNVTMYVSPHLQHTNDTSPSGISSSLWVNITGAPDGSYALSITIWDKAGNNDTTLAGSEAPINLQAGMSGLDIENWFYFYFFRSDGLGLDWRDFNVSYVLDEDYRPYVEDRIRGALFAQKYLNLTSSIRFIVRNYFGDVVQNASYSLPTSFDLYITLPVFTFKVANLYDEVMNMTIERPSASTVYTEQLMPYEIFRWDMYAAEYNITVYIHETDIIALDDAGNSLNDFQVNLTLSDVALFVDAPLTFRELNMIISDIWQFNIITNKDHKATQPMIYIYLNDSLQGDTGFSPGTIVLSRPTYGFYNLTIYANWTTYSFTYQRWITVESNAEITNFVVSGLEEESDEIYISWNTNKGNGILRIYDNTSLVQTNGLEGISLLFKSSTIGIHILQFNVSVESRVFTHYGNYTIADWTVVVTVRIYDEASPWVGIRDTHTVDVTVTRSDEGTFNGYVYLNGTNVQVPIIGGVGSFSIVSTEVTRKRWVVSSVQDLSAQSRDFIANDLLVTFDTLIGTMTMVSTPPFYPSSTITFTVYFNSSYDGTGIEHFRYRVLLNDKTQFDTTDYTFSFTGLSAGSYTVTLEAIENTDNNVEEGLSAGRTFTVEKEPTPLQREAEEFPFLAALMGIFGIGAVIAIWSVYRRRGRPTTTDKQLRAEFKMAEEEYSQAGRE